MFRFIFPFIQILSLIFHTICILFTDFQPLAELTITTTTSATTQTATNICKSRRSAELALLYRRYSLVRLGSGVIESELIASSRTLLACVSQCLFDEACCDVGYSRASGTCFRLMPSGIPTNATTILDCSKLSCYRVKD